MRKQAVAARIGSESCKGSELRSPLLAFLSLSAPFRSASKRSGALTSHPVASLSERMRTIGVCPTRPATPSATLPRSSSQRQRSTVRWRQERAAAEPAQAPIDKRRRDIAAVGSEEEEEEEEHAPGPPLLVGAILLLPSSASFGSRSKKKQTDRCRKMKKLPSPDNHHFQHHPSSTLTPLSHFRLSHLPLKDQTMPSPPASRLFLRFASSNAASVGVEAGFRAR